MQLSFSPLYYIVLFVEWSKATAEWEKCKQGGCLYVWLYFLSIWVKYALL